MTLLEIVTNPLVPSNKALVAGEMTVGAELEPNVTVPTTLPVCPLPEESSAVTEPTTSASFHHSDGLSDDR